jgi:hypothetical protein
MTLVLVISPGFVVANWKYESLRVKKQTDYQSGWLKAYQLPGEQEITI